MGYKGQARRRVCFPDEAACRSLLPPPLAGEGWGGGTILGAALMLAPSLSLPRKRERGRQSRERVGRVSRSP